MIKFCIETLGVPIKFISVILACTFMSFGFSDTKIPIYDIDGIQYISTNEYINITNASSKLYESKKKIEFIFNQSHSIILSQNSSFIIIDKNIYHLYIPVQYKNNDFLIPINPFLNIINNIDAPLAFIDTLGENLMMYQPSFNIDNIQMINKSN